MEAWAREVTSPFQGCCEDIDRAVADFGLRGCRTGLWQGVPHTGFARERAASDLTYISAVFLVLRFLLSSGGFLSKVQAVICAIIVVQSRRKWERENPLGTEERFW